MNESAALFVKNIAFKTTVDDSQFSTEISKSYYAWLSWIFAIATWTGIQFMCVHEVSAFKTVNLVLVCKIVALTSCTQL